MAKIKSSDYRTQTGIVPVDYTRPVKINDVSQEARVVLKMNNKKGLFEIQIKVNSNLITGEEEQDRALLGILNELSIIAIADGEKWRKEWNATRKKDEDPDQLELGIPAESA